MPDWNPLLPNLVIVTFTVVVGLKVILDGINGEYRDGD